MVKPSQMSLLFIDNKSIEAYRCRRVIRTLQSVYPRFGHKINADKEKRKLNV